VNAYLLDRARALVPVLRERGHADAIVLTGDAAGGPGCVVVAVADRFIRPLRSGRWVVQTDEASWRVAGDDVDAMMGASPAKEGA
jgi:hypothetical protein